MKNENEMSRITKNYVEICVGISPCAKWYQALRKEIRGRDVKWNPKGRFHITALFADDDSKKSIGIELHSGRNRIVRRIFEHLGYEVTKLDRVMFAGLDKYKLPRGEWRFLTDLEVVNLKKI